MNASLITTVVPFDAAKFGAVNDEIRELSAQPNVCQRLDDGEFVHFLSIVAVAPVCPSEDWKASQAGSPQPSKGHKKRRAKTDGPDRMAHVIVEITADVTVEQATTQLVEAFGDEIEKVLQTAGVREAKEVSLEAFLLAHQCPIRAGWRWLNKWRGPGRRSELGQTHSGSPGMTVRRIHREAELAEWIHGSLKHLRGHAGWIDASPLRRLEMIREDVWRKARIGGADAKWAFSAESAPCLTADPANPWNDSGYTLSNPQARRALADIVHGLAWPLYAPLAIVLAVLAWLWAGMPSVERCLEALAGSAVVCIAAIGFQHFRRRRSGWVTAFLIACVVFAWLGWLFSFSPEAFGFVVLALPKSFVVVLAVVAAIGYGLYRSLLRLEAKDAESVESCVPPPEQIEALMKQENQPGSVQNHMATVSRIKPGWLRSLTLRLAFLVVGTGHYVGRPGFLGKNGVIHVARWMRLPGTSLLMFWSNFDGTWESYVADFIADAPTGVTAIWSNCIGFPRTESLFSEGAEDRGQLVNWARRQQQPTLFWYSAYPQLTTDRIRTNAAIRQGLASAASDADARDWLSLFGSSQRPAESLDATEIPTLIFGGLSTRPDACMVLIRLGETPDQARTWLRKIEKSVTFGEARPGLPAAVLGLAASGLKKLGLPKDALETFPTAFQQGMWREWRARALGDTGDNAPEHWSWGSTDASQPDAVVVLYAYAVDRHDEHSLPRLVDTVRKASYAHGGGVIETIYLDPPEAPGADRLGIGSFGFKDGVSQPVIRGAPRGGGSAVETDLVSPGELVLGYPDNTHKLPPSPLLEARLDPQHDLPNAGTDPFRRRPEFSRYEPRTGMRDIGANGTFLVVRQLKEEDDAFDDWCRKTYEKMRTEVDIDFDADNRDAAMQAHEQLAGNDSGADSRKETNRRRLMASLLVGRWPDGSSLVRNPRSPATTKSRNARPDNAFRYGIEDPRGFACPFGAHTRRANPRDTRFHDSAADSATEIDAVNRHRILRVGRAYGNSTRSRSGKGLMFMCLNADIERQFEFVQKTWLLNPNIHGLQGETDPLLGRGEGRTFTVPSPAGPVTLALDDFVRMIGGAYFFLPGRATLRYLAHEPPLREAVASPRPVVKEREPVPASVAKCPVAELEGG